MPFEYSMDAAARRHFHDGRALEGDKRFDNAGYHYGLSAECAIKHLCLRSGVRNDEAVIWKHFPELLQMAQVTARGRVGGRLVKMLKPGLFGGWDVKMRYAKNGSVDEATVVRWRDQANEAIGALL